MTRRYAHIDCTRPYETTMMDAEVTNTRRFGTEIESFHRDSPRDVTSVTDHIPLAMDFIRQMQRRQLGFQFVELQCDFIKTFGATAARHQIVHDSHGR